jgi:hypothetical protein
LSLPTNSQIQRTEVIYGSENVLDRLLQFLSKSKTIDSCGDEMSPSLAIELQGQKGFLSKNSATRLKVRFITNITKDNLEYCKSLMKHI